MKSINLLAIGFSVIAIGVFAVGGINDEEAVGIALNCGLIGINYSLWRSK
jgi:hypothetical protein